MKNNTKIWIIGGGILCLIIPYFIYRFICFPNPGGDKENIIALGALLAPFISLFAAIMFYLAISAQRESNIIQQQSVAIQQQSTDISTILKLYEFASIEFDEFEYNNEKGKQAFEAWIGDNIALSNHNFLMDFIGFKFESIMASFKIVLDVINSSALNDVLRMSLRVKLYTLYVDKLGKGVTTLETQYHPNSFASKKYNYVIMVHQEISSLQANFLF